MAEDLLQQLRALESDYPGQPLVAQQADLLAINRLRAQLAMPSVDARLREIGVIRVAPAPEPEPEHAPDHTEARAVYRAYLKKKAKLAIHQAYADRVVRATGGPGQTPVRPLATMGTNGGPLLCDHCGKAIVLEGGRFHGVAADVAWAQSPHDNWRSWILGGLVVEIQTNGTLRIYHGYPGRANNHCCNIASRKDEQAQAKFKSDRTPEDYNRLLAFLTDEFPEQTDKARLSLLNEILNTMYAYDPGLGVNRPSRANEEPDDNDADTRTH